MVVISSLVLLLRFLPLRPLLSLLLLLPHHRRFSPVVAQAQSHSACEADGAFGWGAEDYEDNIPWVVSQCGLFEQLGGSECGGKAQEAKWGDTYCSGRWCIRSPHPRRSDDKSKPRENPPQPASGSPGTGDWSGPAKKPSLNTVRDPWGVLVLYRCHGWRPMPAAGRRCHRQFLQCQWVY